MKNNGQMDDTIEVIPDFENEMVEEVQSTTPPLPKKEGCGCNKNKGAAPSPKETNWTRIALIVGGLILVYFVFFKKKGKIEVPKVEVPEV